MNKYNKIVFVNGSAPALNADNLNHMDEGIERATDGAIALETEITTARGSSNSLGARLDTADANLTKKADKTSTLAGYGIVNAYTKTEMLNFLAKKEDNSNRVSSKTDITDSNTNYPSVKYLNDFYYDASKSYSAEETDKLLGNKADSNSVYSKVETDNLLGNKADLVNSSNIFDFNAWAKEFQKLNKPVTNGTLDELNFDEKSITITPTEMGTYTNTWMLPHAKTMKISVKPNTKYLMCWLTNNYDSKALVYLNGVNTEATRVSITAGGKGAFVTNNDTSFITLRFGTYRNSAFKVSKIMITEAEKESIYLPNKVAEGVPEVANEVFAFEKTTQTSLDSKYDSSNIELGTATLTPYSTQIDKIKSATCVYEKIGDIVITNVTIVMNETSLGATSAIALLNMPFSNKSDVIVHDIGISKNGGMFRGSVNKSAWLQFTPLNKQAYDFVADEQVNFSLIYKI